MGKNAYKTCLPELIIDILKENTEKNGRHFSQKEIGEELERKFPKVSIGRKTLARGIHTLLQEEILGCRGNVREGFWFDEDIMSFFEVEESFNANDRKSLCTCFLKRILENSTNVRRPMSQERLVQELEYYPWSVITQRRKVSGDLASLMEVYPSIRHRENGYYYDSGKMA